MPFGTITVPVMVFGRPSASVERYITCHAFARLRAVGGPAFDGRTRITSPGLPDGIGLGGV